MRENGSTAFDRKARGFYPVTEPYAQQMLAVPGGHEIYVEQCGNPDGQPVVVLHGGPGGGCSPGMRRFFDPKHYRIILFDQRGCGRSKPHASVRNNTTWDLVADIEKIRKTLGIDRWIVFGGSWGATLSLIYAQTHPDRVARLALRGVFLMTEDELEWFYGGGAGRFFPNEWALFRDAIPEDEQGDLIAAYGKRLFDRDIEVQTKFARIWAGWESSLAAMDGPGRGLPSGHYARAFSRLENHYFANRGFLEVDGQILRDMERIAQIPGIIVHGRYDMICPPKMAHALAERWPAGELKITPRDGHALSEPGISTALLAYMDRLRDIDLR